MNIQYDPPVGGGLYIIWLSDTHFYGGRSKSFERRWEYHLKALLAGKYAGTYFQNVWDKYQRFEPQILLLLDSEGDRVLAEQAWLDENFGKPGCVNLSPKADGGCAFRSPETRQKMARTRKASPELREKARASLAENGLKKGYKASDSHRAHNSEVRTGKKQSPETVEKRAAKHRGRRNTEETKKLMSESAKKRAALTPTQHGQETRALISAQQKGRIWVNDGTWNQRVFPGTLECLELFKKGWATGRAQRQPPCPEQHPLSQE